MDAHNRNGICWIESDLGPVLFGLRTAEQLRNSETRETIALVAEYETIIAALESWALAAEVGAEYTADFGENRRLRAVVVFSDDYYTAANVWIEEARGDAW